MHENTSTKISFHQYKDVPAIFSIATNLKKYSMLPLSNENDLYL